jgi:hypothetical protein
MTSMLLPHTFSGMCTGTWMTLPETTPGEPTAAPLAPASAKAVPEATPAAAPATARTIAAFLMDFMGFSCAAGVPAPVGTAPWGTRRAHG